MRTDSRGGAGNLHFHDGCTCHGAPTLKQCTDEAIFRGWPGKVLERTDLRDGVEVKCYSLIGFRFDHWSKYGRFVAEVRQGWTVIPISIEASEVVS